MRTHWRRRLLGVAVPILLLATLPALDAGAASPTTDTATQSALAAPLRANADLSANTLPSGYEFRTIQMNLCNSGYADCYDYPDERPILEAQQIIRDWAPELVTLNEVCENNVRDQLWPVFREAHPNSWTFWAFMPAGDREAGSAFRCKNGERFGNGMLGRMWASSDSPKLGIHGQLYAEELQDTGSNEQRSWLCVNSDNDYWGCTTHLAAGDDAKAMRQCHHLMDAVIVWLWAADIRLPSVVGGDFNLKYDDSPDMQDCVPSGWYRKGDGDVQHIMATNNLAFDYTDEISMIHTDHNAWLVAVTTP
jgi:hypothetical protein